MRPYAALAAIIAAALVCLMVIAAQVLAHPPMAALEDPYEGFEDPITRTDCCGGKDCDRLPVEFVTVEAGSFRVRLTLAQARSFQPAMTVGIDMLIPFKRALPSPHGEFAICLRETPPDAADRQLRRSGRVVCFLAPPGS